MLSVNKVILVGNVGQDPKLTQMKSGKHSLSLNVATTVKWKSKEPNSTEKTEKTDWHRVCVFGEGTVDYLKDKIKKGSRVYIEGKLTQRSWKDADGVTDRFITEVVVSDPAHSVSLLDRTTNTGGEGNYNYQKTSAPYARKTTNSTPDYTQYGSSLDNFDDEVPF